MGFPERSARVYHLRATSRALPCKEEQRFRLQENEPSLRMKGLLLMTISPTSDTLWQVVPFGETGPLHFQFGPLSAWIQKVENDFILYVKRTATEEIRCSVGTDTIAADLKATDRFAYESEFEAIQAVPMLPERSIVVRPENPLKILSGQKTLFFVSIPLTIRFQLVQGAKRITMVDLPTQILSNTLFGDTMTGELSFALKTSAKHRLETLTKRRWRAICAVTVVNKSDRNLDLQRLCVQSRHLGCFQGKDFLWTNPIVVTHHSEKEEIVVTFGETPPDFEPIGERLSEPREPVKKSLLRRGLSQLRLPGFA